MSDRRETVNAPDAPEAVGPYVHAVKAAGLLFCSGQIPLDPRTGELVGVTRGRPGRAVPGEPGRGVPGRRDHARRRGQADDLHDRHDRRSPRSTRCTPRSSSQSRRLGWPSASRAAARRPGRDGRGGRPWGLTPLRPAPRRSPREDIVRAAQALRGVIRETPVLSSRTLSELTGSRSRSRPRTCSAPGSFKLRGALAKLASLRDDECRGGVVAGSAGNHAQAVAYAARARGVHCEVFMPAAASIAKAEAATALGAEVHLIGATVDDVAGRRSRARGRARRPDLRASLQRPRGDRRPGQRRARAARAGSRSRAGDRPAGRRRPAVAAPRSRSSPRAPRSR